MMFNGIRSLPLILVLGVAVNPVLSVASVLDDAEPVNLYAADAGARFVGFDMAALPGGGFAVTWVERNPAEQTESVRLARFDRNGQAQGASLTLEETLDTEEYPRLSDPVIASNGDGDMVVAWNIGEAAPASECRQSAQFRLIDSGGVLSSKHVFEYAMSGFNCHLDIAMNEEGMFVLSMTYPLQSQYIMQVFDHKALALSPPVTRGQVVGPILPMALALQENSGMAVWSEEQHDGDAVLLASRFGLLGWELGDGNFRFDNNAHDADGLNQVAVSVAATPDGGYLGAWLQLEDDGQSPVYSQRIQRWRADGTAVASALVGRAPFHASSARVDLDVGTRDSAIMAWTASHEDGARDRYITVIRGNQAVRDNPTVISQSDAVLFDSSPATKVAVAGDTAMVAWYDQEGENKGPVFKARVGKLPEPAAETKQGGGGGGGPISSLMLFGLLILLFRNRWPDARSTRPEFLTSEGR